MRRITNSRYRAKLDAGFEASKDRPNGTGPVRDGGAKGLTIHDGT